MNIINNKMKNSALDQVKKLRAYQINKFYYKLFHYSYFGDSKMLNNYQKVRSDYKCTLSISNLFTQLNNRVKLNKENYNEFLALNEVSDESTKRIALKSIMLD